MSANSMSVDSMSGSFWASISTSHSFRVVNTVGGVRDIIDTTERLHEILTELASQNRVSTLITQLMTISPLTASICEPGVMTCVDTMLLRTPSAGAAAYLDST